MVENFIDNNLMDHYSNDNPFEISTVWLTFAESSGYPEQFKSFRNSLTVLSQIKGWYFSEAQLLEITKLPTIEAALKANPFYIKVDVVDLEMEDGKAPEQAYIDLLINYIVQRGDMFYDLFYVCKLRNTDFFRLDGFLEFHLSTYYENDFTFYSRFLKILIKQYKGEYLTDTHVELIQEWIIDKEKALVLSVNSPNAIDGVSDSEWHRKGRRKREADDKMTCLNQEQTVLFINYLKQHRVILNGDNLKHMDAGIAFSILTGYSKNTLRQNLSDNGHGLTKSNLVEIDNLLTRMKIAIEKDLKEVKAGKSDTKSDSKSDSKSNSKAA
jgi:hypothetical protein